MTLKIVALESVLFSSVVYNYVGRHSIGICETWKTLEDTLKEYLYILYNGEGFSKHKSNPRVIKNDKFEHKK